VPLPYTKANSIPALITVFYNNFMVTSLQARLEPIRSSTLIWNLEMLDWDGNGGLLISGDPENRQHDLRRR
jgi:hypothetical protein